MKKIYFLAAILLLVSCTGQIAIKDAKKSEILVKDISIKTAGVDASGNMTNAVPSVRIILPKEKELIKNSAVNVKVDASNFRIVPIASPLKEGEGHFHVWLDNDIKIGDYKNFIFENVGSGMHSITVELVRSDHSSLSPRIIKTISIDVESGIVAKTVNLQPGVGEFVVEADDYGFYPSNLTARLNDTVKINFKFRDETIYFAGLDIKGPFPTVHYKLKGQQPMAAEFIMQEDTKITSYWPSSGVKKADLIVNAQR